MYIRIDISSQRLGLFGDDGACLRRYRISTATKGPGEEKGSYQTPRGVTSSAPELARGFRSAQPSAAAGRPVKSGRRSLLPPLWA
jgi:hypothetical protein